jgi:hypothetical protein
MEPEVGHGETEGPLSLQRKSEQQPMQEVMKRMLYSAKIER